MKTYTDRSNAIRAAKRIIAKGDTSATEFMVVACTGGFEVIWIYPTPTIDTAALNAALNGTITAMMAAGTDEVAVEPEVEAPVELVDPVDPIDPETVDVGCDLDDLLAETQAGTLAAPVVPGKPAKAPKAPSAKAIEKAAAVAAAEAGTLPPHLIVKSAANPSYQKRADALRAMAEAGDLAGLEAYAINGTNTYARMVARYRGLLVTALQASAPPSYDTIAMAA